MANASTKRPPRHPAPGPARNNPLDFDPSCTLTEQDDDADIF
ncbi:MAG: hypothetical protein U0359_11250 [Byssovorax sp.]